MLFCLSMPKKEKHNSGIRKIHRYIKDGRSKKLKKLFTTFQQSNDEQLFMDEVNGIHGKRGQTYLHKSCAKGNAAMVRMLLDFGANIGCYDSNNNNVLHLALNYVLESLDQEYFESVVFHLINIASEEMLEFKNKYGETPNELLSEVMAKISDKHNTYLFEREDSFDEKMWNEKLFFEMGCENQYEDETYSQEEFEDTYQKEKKEDFHEWGDRIRQEYSRKHYPRTDNKKEKEEAKKPEIEYGPNLVDDLRKRLKIIEIRNQYEKNCEVIFKSEGDTLYFKDVPWPIAMEKQVGDDEEILNEMIEVLTYGLETDDKRKYLKKQQIRWHPDRFLQKCDHRINVEEREDILKLVSSLSQRINSLVDSIT